MSLPLSILAVSCMSLMGVCYGNSYGFIGEFIVKTCGDLPEHEYTEWAHVYAGEETQVCDSGGL